jgi:hypothetical protein
MCRLISYSLVMIMWIYFNSCLMKSALICSPPPFLRFVDFSVKMTNCTHTHTHTGHTRLSNPLVKSVRTATLLCFSGPFKRPSHGQNAQHSCPLPPSSFNLIRAFFLKGTVLWQKFRLSWSSSLTLRPLARLQLWFRNQCSPSLLMSPRTMNTIGFNTVSPPPSPTHDLSLSLSETERTVFLFKRKPHPPQSQSLSFSFRTSIHDAW